MEHIRIFFSILGAIALIASVIAAVVRKSEPLEDQDYRDEI